MTLPSRRALTIGFAVAGGLVAIALVLIPHDSSPRHSPVYRYVADVDAVQARMTYPLSKVASAYHEVTVGHSTSPTAAQFAAAERTLAKLEARIAALDAPPQAARLRSLILRLVRQETAATREVGTLVRFLAPFQRALTRLRDASAALSRGLAAAQGPVRHKVRGTPAQIRRAQAAFAAASSAAARAQADAVDAYDAVVAHETALLGRLTPPAVLAPQVRYQLLSLRRTSAAGARLAAGLRATTRTNIPQLSHDFAVAARTAQSVAEQRAQIAAVRAYNARFRAISATASAVRLEVARLQSHEN